MTRASDGANGMVLLVEQVCQLYRVPFFRMQSRAFQVEGKGGKSRPMFMGGWTDTLGEKHRAGMADLLLVPKIPFLTGSGVISREPVPLWVEVKYGTGKLSMEQKLFRDYVIATQGEQYYLLVENDHQPLIEWFAVHDVQAT